MNIIWVSALAESLSAALSALCSAKPPFKLCDRFKVEARGDSVIIVGSRAAGVALKYGEGYRAVLAAPWGVYILTYAPGKSTVVSGEACTMVSRVAGGECPRLKYEVWCRWCVAPDGRRYRRCWADATAKSEAVKRGLAQLGLSDIGEERLEEVLKALSSICS